MQLAVDESIVIDRTLEADGVDALVFSVGLTSITPILSHARECVVETHASLCNHCNICVEEMDRNEVKGVLNDK